MIEDPSRQLNYLRQCLSNDKKPLGLLLGAGCPTSIRSGDSTSMPLIPDIAGITHVVRANVALCETCGPFLNIVEEHFRMDELREPTVEDMLTHIRVLRAVAGKGEVRGLSAKNLDDLDDKICQIIHEVADKRLPGSETPYHCLATWVDAVPRQNPIEIFTTNYDLLMEEAFEDSRVPYFDGFAGVRKPFFDIRAMEEDGLPPRWARLWKLHGSINWYQVHDKGVFRGNAPEVGSVRRVIHPSYLKYQESRRLPYLAMFDRLRAFLKRPTAALIICGYSFRDEHVNEVVVQGLESTPKNVAFALLFGRIEGYQQAVSLARGRSNLNILACDGAVISGQVLKWPVRDPETIAANRSEWVKWIPVDPANDGGTCSAELTLGDFAIFGRFLRELVGEIRQTPEPVNA